jgi:hypothetical protein
MTTSRAIKRWHVASRVAIDLEQPTNSVLVFGD